MAGLGERVPERPAVLGSDLCWLLTRASARQEREFEADALAASGLTARKHQLLKAALSGEYTQNQLARSVGVDTTTMVTTVDELERDGLAERRVSPADRRARMVHVTPEGRAAVLRCDDALLETQERILEGLPPQDRVALLRALAHLAFSDFPAGRATEAEMPSSATPRRTPGRPV